MICFCEMAFSQKDRKQSWEMGPEKLLQTYQLSEERTALLFSQLTTKTFKKHDVQGIIKFRRFYVEIEEHKTRERRRIWQVDFNNIPQNIPRSFAFGPAESPGQFCIGMASDFRVYYALLPARKDELSINLSSTLNHLNIRDLLIYDTLDFLRVARSGILIDRIAYTLQEWTLGIQIRIMNDTMMKLELYGVPTEHGIQWKTRFF